MARDQAEITAVRSWRAPDNTRVVLDLSGPVKCEQSPDSSPARLIFDIDGATLKHDFSKLAVADGPVRSVRIESRPNGGARIWLDLGAEVSSRIFQLPPNEKYGYRLVLDLYDHPASRQVVTATDVPAKPTEGQSAAPKTSELKTSEAKIEPKIDAKPEVKGADNTVAENKSANVVDEKKTPVERDPASKRGRNIVVAIDAGHGGEDTGAIGPGKSYEKNVTLAIARALQSKLRDEPGFSPELTRNGDYFIPLKDRREIARRKYKADIFVSVHADSSPSHEAHGASVFALSLKGAGTATSRFARALADRENKADLIGGVPVDTHDDVLAGVLADMVVEGSLEHSLRMGRGILDQLGEFSTLHAHQVEQAGFAVLKEPGMVSLLVENGFISNPSEEKKLNDASYQKKLAQAILTGVKQYCEQYPLPGTYFAWRAEKGRQHEGSSLPSHGHKSHKRDTAMVDRSRRLS